MYSKGKQTHTGLGGGGGLWTKQWPHGDGGGDGDGGVGGRGGRGGRGGGGMDGGGGMGLVEHCALQSSGR